LFGGHRAVLISVGTNGAYAYYLRGEKQAQAVGVKMIVDGVMLAGCR
jgi:hypothetical protein